MTGASSGFGFGSAGTGNTAGAGIGSGTSGFSRGIGSNTGRTTTSRTQVQESLDNSDFSAYDNSDQDADVPSRDSFSEGADAKALFEKHHCARHGCKVRRSL